MGAGLGLTAFALVPFLELSGNLGFEPLSSHFHTAELKRGLIFAQLWELPMLFVPYLRGAPLGTFEGTSSVATRNYVGVAVAVVGIVGLWNRPAMKRGGPD